MKVLFYSGLLELSKSFLDPFGNRRVSTTDLSAEINIDTLIGEANAGSLVWPLGAQRMPFLSRRASPSSHPWSAPVIPQAPPEGPRPGAVASPEAAPAVPPGPAAAAAAAWAGPTAP